MKKILLAGVAITALAVAAPANAADLRMPVKAAPIAAPAPYFSWTGCYIGPHIGWGWGQKTFTSTTATAEGTVDTSGALFGGQLGCNYQLQGNWVLGLEGSIAAADINGFDHSRGSSPDALHVKTDFLASLTGRIGWNGWNPRVLFYFRGGVAWANDQYGIGGDEAVLKESRTGWTIGGGFEWAFAPNWSAFFEYDHYDFGTKDNLFFTTCSFSDCTIGPVSISQTIDTVKLGLNYRFNDWIGPLAIGKGPRY